MSTNAKLILVMVVVGTVLAGINTGLIGWYTSVQTGKTLEQMIAANKQAELTNADLKAKAQSGDITQEELDEQLVPAEPVDEWIVRNDWVVMTAWLGIAQFGMLALVAIMLWRRDTTLPLTWAEALVYSGVAFGFLVIAFGFIPHYIITVWDTIISPNFTAPVASILPTKLVARWFNPNALGWEWSWNAIRDMIVAAWYSIALVAMFALWYWAQEYPKRTKRKVAAEQPLKSPYGRPMATVGK